MSLNTEPVLVMVAVQAFVALAVSFGLHLSADQTAAIMAAVAAALGLVTRQRVSPVVASLESTDGEAE